MNKEIERPHHFHLLYNPFEKIGGFYALLLGILIILLMNFFASLINTHFPGIVDYNLAPIDLNNNSKEIKISYLFLLYETLVSWIVLSSLYFAFAKIFKQKNLRAIDFFGSVAFSRYPYLIQAALTNVVFLIDPTIRRSGHISVMSLVNDALILSCFFWQMLTYFFALQVSSGLVGKKLWISFMGSIAIGEIVTALLTRSFFPVSWSP